MSDEVKQELIVIEPTSKTAKEEKIAKAEETRQFRLDVRRKLIELTGESEWTLTQQLMQEAQSDFLITDTKKKPSVPELIKKTKQLIEERYKDESELKELLLDSMPGITGIHKWLKSSGWEDAVWSKIRTAALFSKEARAEVIQALKKRAVEGSDSAAKIWLTLSGDYSDKIDVNSDKRVEVYREINQILHKAKKDQ